MAHLKEERGKEGRGVIEDRDVGYVDSRHLSGDYE